MAKPSPEPCPKSKSLSPVKNPGRYGFHFRLDRQERKNLRPSIDEIEVVLPGRIIVEGECHIDVFKNPAECLRAVIFVQRPKGKKRLLRMVVENDSGGVGTLSAVQPAQRNAGIEYAYRSERQAAPGQIFKGEPEAWDLAV